MDPVAPRRAIIGSGGDCCAFTAGFGEYMDKGGFCRDLREKETWLRLLGYAQSNPTDPVADAGSHGSAPLGAAVRVGTAVTFAGVAVAVASLFSGVLGLRK